MSLILKDIATDDLEKVIVSWGGHARVARQLQDLTMKRGVESLPTAVSGIGRRMWERVHAETTLPHLTLVDKATSPLDGFSKYLFRGKDEKVFEAVRIPLMHRPGDEKYVVCVSSQVGCAAKCAFCATGRMGFLRNLEAWEMVDQIVKIQADSAFPVRGVVFMGMGEPFLNYSRVMRAAKLMTEPSGLAIDAKSITISTVGIAPMIRRFTQERRQFRLIFSLTSAIPALRDELLPMNLVHPLDEVFAALREYQTVRNKMVTLAWTMISGVNMGEDQVLALAALTKGLRIKLDLIPVNDSTGQFFPPDRAEIGRFLDLVRAKIACPIAHRYSGGRDIHGACGMLAGRRIDEAKSSTVTEAKLNASLTDAEITYS